MCAAVCTTNFEQELTEASEMRLRKHCQLKPMFTNYGLDAEIEITFHAILPIEICPR